MDCEGTALAILAVTTMVWSVAETCFCKSALMCVSANRTPQLQHLVVWDRFQFSNRCVKAAVETAPGRRTWKDQLAHYILANEHKQRAKTAVAYSRSDFQSVKRKALAVHPRRGLASSVASGGQTLRGKPQHHSGQALTQVKRDHSKFQRGPVGRKRGQTNGKYVGTRNGVRIPRCRLRVTNGQKPRSASRPLLPPITDLRRTSQHVSFVPGRHGSSGDIGRGRSRIPINW